MLIPPANAKIFVCTSVTDMRKGFAGLSAIVRERFDADPTDGNLFIFINRRRDRMKLLHFAEGGFWLYYRLLEDQEFLKLWKERFAAKSERYIADPDQLRIDFGDTPESSDAADGLHEAIEEADLIPAHTRRKPKKKRTPFRLTSPAPKKSSTSMTPRKPVRTTGKSNCFPKRCGTCGKSWS